MVAVRSSYTLVLIYQTTWCHISEGAIYTVTAVRISKLTILTLAINRTEKSDYFQPLASYASLADPECATVWGRTMKGKKKRRKRQPGE
jgi:hypothetical protein